MIRIAILGANGQVGWELSRSLQPIADVVCAGRSEADLAHPSSVVAYLQRVCPAVIVNAAAYTAVDRAEGESALAHTVNARAPAEMARVAKELGALLIHYSTDYVFDGESDGPYLEIDTPKPLNVYGRSKLDGERAIASAECDHLVLRTSWVYARRGNNFVRTVLRLARESDVLRIVADQTGAPTGAALIADTTAHVIVRAMQERGVGSFESGTFHITAAGSTTWYGLASRVVARAAAIDAFAGRVVAVQPITTTEYPVAAARPRNSLLDTSRVRDRFGIALPDWTEGVDHCVDDLLAP